MHSLFSIECCVHSSFIYLIYSNMSDSTIHTHPPQAIHFALKIYQRCEAERLAAERKEKEEEGNTEPDKSSNDLSFSAVVSQEFENKFKVTVESLIKNSAAVENGNGNGTVAAVEGQGDGQVKEGKSGEKKEKEKKKKRREVASECTSSSHQNEE